MGTPAENERIKLKAAFYNNIAAGTAVAGLALPYIAFYSRFYSTAGFKQLFENPLQFFNLETIVGMISAALIAFICRSRADAWIQTLDDDE